MSASMDIERTVEVIWRAYICEGIDGLSARELGARLDVSPSTARRWVERVFENDRGWRRIIPTRKQIEIIERNFNSVSGYRMVDAWEITKDLVAERYRGVINIRLPEVQEHD